MEVEILSSEKDIENFTIEGIETSILQSDKIININTSASQTDYLFSPKIIVSNKASISPASEILLDFTNQIEYTVTAEDGSKKIYKTILNKKNGLENIKLRLESNGVQTQIYTGIINENDKKIFIDFPKSTINTWNYLTYLEINLLGENLSSIPETNNEINIESLEQIQVIQPEGTTTYSIDFRNTENFLSCFGLPIITNFPCAHTASNTYDEYTNGLNNNDLVFFTLENQNITTISPNIFNVSTGATVVPSPDTVLDFTNDITYQVTSESGILKPYKIRVIKKKILLGNDWSPILFNGVSSSSSSFFLYYNAISKISEATLVNIDTNIEVPCQILGNDYIDPSTETYIVLNYDTQLNAGERYYLRVTLENGITIDTKYKISIS